MKNIDYAAFSDCWKLSTVIIGNDVTNIGKGAFIRCSGLKDMYLYTEQLPELGGDLFDYSNRNATLHVPASSIDTYQNAEQWKNFKEIVALTDDDPKPTGIQGINNNVMTAKRYNSLDGKQTITHQKGLNIIKMSDGTTKKVILK